MAEPKGDTPTKDQDGSVDTAAQAIFGFLGDDPEFKDDDSNDDQDQDDSDSDPEEEESESDDDDDESASSDDDDSEADDEEDEDEEAADDPASKPTYKVKVDGEEIEVTLDEALSGYQRQRAFTKKTTELANERKANLEERRQLQSERAEYQQRLDVVKRLLESGVQDEPNWEQLKKDDPEKYAETRLAWQERKDQIAAVETEQKRIQEANAKEFETQRAEMAAAEYDKLIAAIPEWVDSSRRDADAKAMADYGAEMGFTPEELQGVADHRALVLLRKAMLYDKGKSRVKNAEKGKGRDRKVTLKPGASKQDRKPAKKARLEKRQQRLAKTGRITDAAAAFAEMLAQEDK